MSRWAVPGLNLGWYASGCAPKAGPRWSAIVGIVCTCLQTRICGTWAVPSVRKYVHFKCVKFQHTGVFCASKGCEWTCQHTNAITDCVAETTYETRRTESHTEDLGNLGACCFGT